jgi:GT2 family glycosyltransferase
MFCKSRASVECLMLPLVVLLAQIVPTAPVFLSVIVPVFNGASTIRNCLSHIRDCHAGSMECIVVDDGSWDGSAGIAKEFGCRVVTTAGRKGPALARNLGARTARGEILLFVDADVCVDPNAFQLVQRAFMDDPELDAIIGSYDDTPGAPNLLSQYRNLLHCYVHRHGRRQASTFWTGFGAIRRAAFLESGGFDDSYSRSSVEDIELGYRLCKSGAKMALDPAMSVKHLKHWTLSSMIRSDIFDRGIPWAELIVRERMMPNDLNLRMSQRLSVLLMAALVPLGAIALLSSAAQVLLGLCLIAYVAFASFFTGAALIRNRDRLIAVLTLAAGIAFLSFHAGIPWIIPVAAAVHPLIWLRTWMAKRGGLERKTVDLAAAVYLSSMLAVGLASISNPLLFSIWGILAAVVLLNLDFYLFLGSRLGGIESIAAIPFHLLFHLYSGYAMVAGVVKHFSYGKPRSMHLPALMADFYCVQETMTQDTAPASRVA